MSLRSRVIGWILWFEQTRVIARDLSPDNFFEGGILTYWVPTEEEALRRLDVPLHKRRGRYARALTRSHVM